MSQKIRPPMGGMGPGAKGVVEKPQDFKGTTKKLIKDYLSNYKIALLIVIIFAIGSTVFMVVGPKILGNATTEIFNGLVSKLSGGSGIDFGKIATILLSLLGLYIVSQIFSLVQGFTMTSVVQKITYKLRNDLAKKINKLPMHYFDTKTHGEVLSIITSKCYTNYYIYMYNYRDISNDVINKLDNDINIFNNITNYSFYIKKDCK